MPGDAPQPQAAWQRLRLINRRQTRVSISATSTSSLPAKGAQAGRSAGRPAALRSDPPSPPAPQAQPGGCGHALACPADGRAGDSRPGCGCPCEPTRRGHLPCPSIYMSARPVFSSIGLWGEDRDGFTECIPQKPSNLLKKEGLTVAKFRRVWPIWGKLVREFSHRSPQGLQKHDHLITFPGTELLVFV